MTVSAHCMVKNDDQWIWYAIQSILPVVDTIHVYDTGSTDNTLKIVRSINSNKIQIKEFLTNTAEEITLCRQKMMDVEKNDWVLFLDGDEIWPDLALKKSVESIQKNPSIDYLISSYRNLLGDVYHYQENSAGKYKIKDKEGHITIRWINRKKLAPLMFRSNYPYEELCLKNGMALQKDTKLSSIFIDEPYLHATHLVRSSNEEATFNRKYKIKYEFGHKNSESFIYPTSFYFPHGNLIPSAWTERKIKYNFFASIQTPIKKLKRKLLI